MKDLIAWARSVLHYVHLFLVHLHLEELLVLHSANWLFYGDCSCRYSGVCYNERNWFQNLLRYSISSF